MEPRALLHALQHYALQAKITLADFNLAVSIQTAKPPNLLPCQIFRLYGTCRYIDDLVTLKVGLA